MRRDRPTGALPQALTTEQFTLQTARSASIADSNGRSALYLSTVSGAVVALAFIGQVAQVGQPFFLFALALLPALVLLGVLTYLRLLESAIEDLFYARAINRIRRYYLGLGPDAARWFLLAGHDDPAGAMASMGCPPPGGTCCRTPPPWSPWSPWSPSSSAARSWPSRPAPLVQGGYPWSPAPPWACWWRWLDRPVLAPPGATLARAEQAVRPLSPSPTAPSDVTPHRRPHDLPEGRAQ